LLTLAASLLCSGSRADVAAVHVPFPAAAPSTVMADQFVVEFKREVAHRLEIARDFQGRPHANVAGVQRALERVAATRAEREFVRAKPQAAGSRFHDLTGYYLVTIPEGADLTAAMDAMAAEPDVDHVEPIGIHPVYLDPNDPYYFDEWGLWDQYGVGADLAWNFKTGSPTVLVGILDTGVKYRHSDLGGVNPPGPADNSTQGNIWVNPGEIPGNGIDDDANGRVDDIIGYDFVNKAVSLPQGYSCFDHDCGGFDNDPNDGNGHGTHVAGTVAAITNNGDGVAGVAGGYGDGTTNVPANGVKLVPCRIGVTASNGVQTNGYVSMAAAADAMDYLAGLVDDGFDVASINCSWGSSNSGGISAAADNLLAHDVMIMVAAGNENSGTPTSFLVTKPGVMVVGATDQSGRGASFTNYGTWVDLAAPGVSVTSTWHNYNDADTTNMYVAALSGTSMAAPHAAGVAALLESYNPALTRADKFDLMVNHTKPFGAGNTKQLGTGILDAAAALAAAPVPATAVSPTMDVHPGMLSLVASPNPGRSGSDLLVRAAPGERVHLAVVDAAGRQVRSLEGVAAANGELRVRWDGRDSSGRRAGLGLYLIQASKEGERASAKLVLLD